MAATSPTAARVPRESREAARVTRRSGSSIAHSTAASRALANPQRDSLHFDVGSLQGRIGPRDGCDVQRRSGDRFAAWHGNEWHSAMAAILLIE
jgi:hypothetical protein